MALSEEIFWENTLKKSSSASIGALLTSLVVTPLDVAKVRLQTQTRGSMTFKANKCLSKCAMQKHISKMSLSKLHPCKTSSIRSMSCATCVFAPVRLNGTLDALRHIAKTEGFQGLWSGLPPTLLLAIPSTVCYFSFYDFLLHKGERDLPISLQGIAPLVAGVSARIAAASIVSPLELVRTRMQSERSVNGFLHAFRQIHQTGGLNALMRGLGATLARDVPFSGIYWTCYEGFKRKLQQYKLVHELDLSHVQISFISGACAGTIAATCTTPFDVVKTLQQVEHETNIRVPKGLRIPISEQSTFTVLRRIVRTKGIQGTMVGLSARLARIAPGCAIMISSYELGKSYFGLQDD